MNTASVDVRLFTMNNGITVRLSRFQIFPTYEDMLLGDPLSESVKRGLLTSRNDITKDYLDDIPHFCLTSLEDFHEDFALGAYWHIAELSCHDDLEFGPLERDFRQNDVDWSAFGFSWAADEPSFTVTSPAAERLLAFDWIKQAALVSDLFGIIKRRHERDEDTT